MTRVLGAPPRTPEEWKMVEDGWFAIRLIWFALMTLVGFLIGTFLFGGG